MRYLYIFNKSYCVKELTYKKHLINLNNQYNTKRMQLYNNKSVCQTNQLTFVSLFFYTRKIYLFS